LPLISSSYEVQYPVHTLIDRFGRGALETSE
jgi:hypothetical protein